MICEQPPRANRKGTVMMQLCKQPQCSKGNSMGDYCIEHWYTSRGKVCPGFEPGGEFTQPALARNTVVTGRQRTSRNAAANALPKSGTNRARIFHFIKAHGGATDEEVEIGLNLSGNTVRPCRVSLVKDGYVYDTGTVRQVRSGNDAIVWGIA
jgi:hypothetical protein